MAAGRADSSPSTTTVVSASRMAVPASHLPHRARQGELVYARRPQAVDQAPDLAIQARGRALGGLQVERDQIGYRACLQGQAGQSGSQAVVSAQPPPLWWL